MSWINPKYWTATDKINYTDYNRIKNDVNELYGMLTDPDFEIEDMGSDKAVNDLWYADEVNLIVENLDRIAEGIGADFKNKPYYYPNGDTPTYMELNVIEQTLRNLYNRVNKSYRNYVGTGYVGAYIANRLI